MYKHSAELDNTIIARRTSAISQAVFCENKPPDFFLNIITMLIVCKLISVQTEQMSFSGYIRLIRISIHVELSTG